MTAPNASAPNPLNPTGAATPASSATPSSSTQAAGAAPLRDAAGQFASVRDYRLTAADAQAMGLPSWAVGRTSAEGFQLANQLYQQSLAGGQPEPNRYTPAPNPTTPSYNGGAGYTGQPIPGGRPGAQPPSADDWAADPAGAQQRYNAYIYETQIAPQFTGLAQQNAATSLELVRQQERDAFGRWEPEIMMRLQGVDRSLWTPENVRTVVGLVKAQHLDDLLAERTEAEIQRRMQAGALSRPSDSGAPGAGQPAAGTLDFDIGALPPQTREMYENIGIIRNGAFGTSFWEFCDKMKGPGQTRETFAKEWYESAKGGNTLVATLKGRDGEGNARAAVGDVGVFG
jgi:hypothetical protein